MCCLINTFQCGLQWEPKEYGAFATVMRGSDILRCLQQLQCDIIVSVISIGGKVSTPGVWWSAFVMKGNAKLFKFGENRDMTFFSWPKGTGLEMAAMTHPR